MATFRTPDVLRILRSIRLRTRGPECCFQPLKGSLTLSQWELLSGPRFPLKLSEEAFLSVCAYVHMCALSLLQPTALQVHAGEEHTIRNVPQCTKDEAVSSWWGRVAVNLWANVDPIGKLILTMYLLHTKKEKENL